MNVGKILETSGKILANNKAFQLQVLLITTNI